ncbi:MAG: flagellar filament capping protein FliD, partial [Planctomycetota bacterium]
DIDRALDGGSFDVRVGGQLDTSARLSDLNGGLGFQQGRIQITDRQGATSTIDLRGVTTVDDVLEAINTSGEIEVSATTSGDRIVLTDQSGGTGTFRVREYGGGTTAASLGLGGLSGSTDTLTGADVYGVGTGTRIDTLNDGRGVWTSVAEVDDLRITARDEAVFGVDLAGVDTLGDVVEAINNAEGNDGRVTASITDGARLTLTDTTGASDTSLSVDSGPVGSAAADLGLLTDRDAVDTTITGGRLVAGLRDTLLGSLNGGDGVAAGSISVTNRAGVGPTTIDLSSAETLGEVIDTINSAGAGVEARIGDSRNTLLITDTSGGDGVLAIGDAGSTTAADLGIVVNSSVASLNGAALDRQTVGLGTRLADFGGGVTPGQIQITDSAGVTSTIDLRFTNRQDATIGDVIDKINAASVEVTASINERGDGLLLTDTAGGSGSLEVAESGGSTAADLRIIGDSTATDEQGRQTIDAGTSLTLDLSEFSTTAEETPLSLLNNGAGVDADGVFRITDSAGRSEQVSLFGATTLQDALDRINAASVGVTAEIAASGTRIQLTDNAGGNGALTIEDIGSGTGAADLGIEGEDTGSGNSSPRIVGGNVLDNDEPIEKLVSRINAAGIGVNAALVFDGSEYRVSLVSETSGAGSDLIVTTDGGELSFSESARGTDAAALFGAEGAGGYVVTSDDGRYEDVINGVTLDVAQADGVEAVIDIAAEDDSIVDAVQSFVDAYNGVREDLDSLASFDSETLTTGLLFGRTEALRVDADLSRLASGQFFVGGKYTSLESIGVSLNEDGTLSLDRGELTEALADDRAGVERLLSDENRGVAAAFVTATDALAGDDNSLLSSRSESLKSSVETNTERIADWDLRLERQRESLLLEYIRLEETIAGLQDNLSILDTIQPISIQTSSPSSN